MKYVFNSNRIKIITKSSNLLCSFFIICLILTFFLSAISSNSFALKRCIDYNLNLKIITIDCDQILNEAVLNNNKNSLLEKESNGIWVLNASIIVLPKSQLIMEGKDISWLKILNKPDGQPNQILIQGSAKFDRVKITSWDPVNNETIKQNQNGSIPRPYIIIEKSEKPTEITNSEIAFLGINEYPHNGLVFAHGGYGSIIKNNTIHDMWDGFYSNSAGFIEINNNTFYHNHRFGIDIHSGSHDIKAYGNNVYNNGRIGINCSENCYNVLFQYNKVHHNSIAGLMFSLNTQNSIMKSNNIYNEKTGISLFSASNNIIENNTLRLNNENIFLGGNSLQNLISNNTLS